MYSITETTWKKLMSNGSRYVVPTYQRSYSWSEEEWEDLWNDIDALRRGEKEKHFTGTLVLKRIPKMPTEIIDGQQRIATLSVLVLAAIQQLKVMSASEDSDDNLARVNILQDTFIHTKSPKSLLNEQKLKLNRENNSFYYNLALGIMPRSLGTTSKGGKRLYRAYLYFQAEIKKLKLDGSALTVLVQETIGDGINLIEINVNDTEDAYTIFESLNARGMMLAPSDLVKNFLFSQIADKSATVEQIEDIWQGITTNIPDTQLPTFLRHQWNSYYPNLVRKDSIFRSLKDKLTTPEASLNYLNELNEDSNVYAALQDSSHGFWDSGNKRDVKPLIEVLKLFGASQVYSPLLAAYRMLDDSSNEFAQVLKYLVNLTFRYSVIGNRNANSLEVAYNKLSVHLRKGGKLKFNTVKDILKDVETDDEAFMNNFTIKDFPTINSSSKKLIRYILLSLQSVEYPNPKIDWQNDEATIEHIMPQELDNLSSTYFTSAEHAQYINHIGNLALLEGNLNREASRLPILEKLTIYQRSKYALTKDISILQEENWSRKALVERARDLAQLAVLAWPLRQA